MRHFPDTSDFAPGDADRQAGRCLEIIRNALSSLGATLADVVRSRMFVTNIRRWQDIGPPIASSSATTDPARRWSSSRR